MELVFLMCILLLVLVAEMFLKNLWWIGFLAIVYIIYSIFHQILEVEDHFDLGEFMIIMLKVAAIAVIVVLMLVV